MEILKAIIIAVVQGITEFIPVSSSGHIILLKKILGLEVNQSFDIILHMGTLVSVVFVFRKELIEMFTGVFHSNINSKLYGVDIKRKSTMKIWLFYIIATIPAGISGLLLKDYFDKTPSEMNRPFFILLSTCFCITAILLLISRFIRYKKTDNILTMGYTQALTIGLFQAIGVLPGVSRSGSTIFGAIASGINREDAARFSFILSIPIILASFLLDIVKAIGSGISSGTNTATISELTAVSSNIIPINLVGFFVALITGYFSLVLLLKLIKTGKLWFFAIYLIIPATTSLIISLSMKS